MVRCAVVLSLFLAASCSFAQAPEKSLTFEAASIKPASLPTPDGRGMIRIMPPSGGPGTKDPGRINYPFASLKYLLFTAFNVKDFQISGPPWLDTEHFEIIATMPPSTTKEQFRVMLQNLLAERFKLAIHRDSKDLPMYSLVVNKGSPKLKVSDPSEGDQDASPILPPAGPPKIGADGFPELPPIGGRAGLFNIMMPGRAKMIAHLQTMQDLADRLSTQLARPVIDNTGLKDKYDFTIIFLPEQMNGPMGPLPPPAGAGAGAVTVAGPGLGGAAPSADAEPVPTLFAALQSQLGLKLEAKKGPVEIILIDHIEKNPTDN
jgi:uncharacterized protein (TIGR03435 family)